MVVDSHVHLYPDAIAAKVTASLGAKFGNAPAFVATVAGCAAHDAKSGVDWSLNLPVATSPDQVPPINRWAQAIDDPHVRSLAALHPDCSDRPALVADIAARGFRGIKFHPEYQKFRFNEPRMDEVWRAMSEQGLVAYLHAGGERVFRPPFHSTPAEIATLKRRFPALTIVAAHLGGFEMWEEAERELCGTEVYLDLSHTFHWMPDEQILRLIRRHGAGHVLFGSDAPWQDPADTLAAFRALPLTADEQNAILFENACRLFGDRR